VTMAKEADPSGLPVGDLPTHGDMSVNLPTPRRALAVGAHPDDVEFGCGATLAKWAHAGCEIHHLVLTDGSKGTWEAGDDPARLIAVRQEEQVAAARSLGGGDVRFLGLVDGELGSGLEERREVCRVIRQVRPEVVLGHDPWRRYRLHPDHRHAGWLTTDGIVAARDPKFFSELEEPPHRPAALLLWEADEPNHVEEACEGVEPKLAALLAHTSQYRSTLDVDLDDAQGGAGGIDRFRARLARQLAAHGALAGFESGEAFRLLTDL